MAGALQLIARQQVAQVPPVPSPENPGEPLEAAPPLAVPRVPPVPPSNRKARDEVRTTATEHGHTISTAATASQAWITARDAYINHLMGCRACHAPTGRHCLAGADLRACYNLTT